MRPIVSGGMEEAVVVREGYDIAACTQINLISQSINAHVQSSQPARLRGGAAGRRFIERASSTYTAAAHQTHQCASIDRTTYERASGLGMNAIRVYKYTSFKQCTQYIIHRLNSFERATVGCGSWLYDAGALIVSRENSPLVEDADGIDDVPLFLRHHIHT